MENDGTASGKSTSTAAAAKSGGKSTAVEPVDELDFSGDPAEALLILLNIAHLHFISVPSTLSLDTLSQVAILCDQYDCVQLVKPWLSGWLVQENTQWRKVPDWNTTVPGREKWLFIAWVFGRSEVFKNFASLLVREMATYDDIYGPTPPGLIGTLF